MLHSRWKAALTLAILERGGHLEQEKNEKVGELQLVYLVSMAGLIGKSIVSLPAL